MGGKRQANILSAIISNFDVVEDVIDTSLNSQNSAIKENEKYLESIQGRLDKFNNATQTMWSNFFSTGLIKGFVDSGTAFVELLNKIGGGATAATIAVVGLVTSITSMSIAQSIKTKGLDLTTALGKNFKSFFGGVTKGFNKLIGFITSPTGIVAVAAAAFALIFDAITTTAQEAADKANEKFSEISSVLNETKDNIKSMNAELEGIEDKISELDGKKLSFAEEEELNRLKQERNELEQILETQKQILELQQSAANKSAITTMSAYTKAASAGAEETIKTHKTVASIIGAGALAIGAIAATIGTGGAASAAILPALVSGGIGWSAGSKLGEFTGSKASENDGTYDSWYDTYIKAIDAAQQKEKAALKEYEKDHSNMEKLEKWREAQQKTQDIEAEMYQHIDQMQSYYNDLEYGQSEQIDKKLDEFNNFRDKFLVQERSSGAKANAIDRLFGANATSDLQNFKEDMIHAAEIGDSVNFTELDAKMLGIKDDLDYIGISVEEVTKHFTQLGEEASKSINKIDFSDIISNLAKIESSFESLFSAMEEFMSDGSASAGTIEGMKEIFGDLDSWDYYVETMLSGESSRHAAQLAGEILAKEYLDSVSSTITKDNRLGYISALEKLNVDNADEVVDSYINNSFFNSNAIEKYSVGYSNLDAEERLKVAKELVDVANEEYDIILKISDAKDLLLKADKLRAADNYKDSTNAIRSEIQEKLDKRDAILSSGIISEHTYKEMLHIMNKSGEFAKYEDEVLDSVYEKVKNDITKTLNDAGYEFEELFPDVDVDDIDAIDADLADIDEYVNNLGKEYEDKKKSLTVNVPLDVDFDAKDYIDDMSEMEDATSALGEVYNELKENKNVSASTLAGLSDIFNIPDVNEEYESFINTLSVAKSVTPEVREEFNKLISAWLGASGVLDRVTEETREQTEAFLKQRGIMDAQSVVEQAITQNKIRDNIELLASKEYLLETDIDIIDALRDQTEKMAIQCGVVDELQEVYAKLDFYKDFYTDIDISSMTLEEAEALLVAAEEAKIYAKNLDALKKIKENLEIIEQAENKNNMIAQNPAYAFGWVGQKLIKEEVDSNNKLIAEKKAENQRLYDEMDSYADTKIEERFKAIVEKVDFSALGGAKSDDGTVFDWIDNYFTDIENSIKEKEAELEHAISDPDKIKDTNTIIDQVISLYGDKTAKLKEAMSGYAARAAILFNSFDSNIQAKIKDGSLDITEYDGDLAEDLQEYFDYVTKQSDIKVELKNIKITVADLSKQKFDNIATALDNQIETKFQAKQDALEAQIELTEEKGMHVSTKFYQELIDIQNEEQKALENKLKVLKQTLSAEVAAGNIEVNSSQWYEMVNAINEVNSAIIEGQTEIEKWNNAINEIHWENFDRLISQFDAVESEIESLYEVLSDDDKVVDDLGNWTDEGIAALGLLTQKMELAQYSAEQYAAEIKELEETKDRYSENEYNEKLIELSEKQWESVEAYEAAKDEIVALNKVRIDAVKKGMQEEIDAYKELIDLKKESLDEDKEAREFADNVSEKEKNIAKIERQLAAIKNNTSAEAAAKRKQLQAELLEARAELEDFYYDHSVDVQKDALDKEAEAFEKNKQDEMDKLDEWLENTDKVVAESTKLAKDNAEAVFNTLKETATTYGIEINDIISDAVISPWEDGANAITNYVTAFGAVADSFIEKLGGIKQAQQDLIDQADTYADGVISSVNQSSMGVTSGKTIEDYSKEYFEARKNLDSSGMSAANAGANAIRKENGEKEQHASSDIPYIEGLAKELDQCKQTWAETEAAYKSGQISAQEAYETMKAANDRANEIRKEVGADVQDASAALNNIPHHAKGTLGTKRSGLSWVDEMGLEEIVMHAGPDGRLQYLSKGSAVIPHDISENLMKLGQLDPSQVLEHSKVSLGAPHITTNNMEINLHIGEVVHVDHADTGSIPDIAKAVQTQMDRYMKNINNSLKKKVR